MYAISICQSSNSSVGGASHILFLCLGIIVQMLGVPATLLEPADSPDLFAAYALEGLTLPTTLPSMHTPSGSSLAINVPLTADIPILPYTLFRPPLI